MHPDTRCHVGPCELACVIWQVLEGQLPLEWEAVITLGCCVVPTPYAATRSLAQTFGLDDLVVSLPSIAHADYTCCVAKSTKLHSVLPLISI